MTRAQRLLQTTAEVRAAAGLPPATLKTAAGKRHSQADQDSLDAAATHAAAVTTHLNDAGAVPADIDEEDPYQGSAKLTANERYKEKLSRQFSRLRAATQRREAHDAAHPLTMRTLEEPEDVPDGYARALEDRKPTQHDLEPDVDPRYKPFGRPPDGYALGLALRKLSAQQEAK